MVISTPTPTPYSKADLTMTYLGIRAVGNAGALTTIPVPVTGLVDNALQQITPHVSISAPMAITSLLAETSLAQAKDSDGVMVVKVNIDRIKDISDNSTANITGGIGCYMATVTAGPSG